MSRNPTRDFYLSIDNTDPFDLPAYEGDGSDWPDAPLPLTQQTTPYHYGEPGRAEGVLSLACAIGGVTFFGLVAFAAYSAVM